MHKNFCGPTEELPSLRIHDRGGKGVQILNCPWPPCATSPVSSVVSFRVSLFEQTLTAGTIVPSVKQLNHALNYGIDIVNQFLGILTVFQTVLKSKNL